MRHPSRLSLSTRATALVFVLLSSLYFIDTLLRASLKAFWVDELLTVYLCRLPSFHDTWTAVLHGCDFNPPLFYLLTRGSERLFGEGLIATRLPAILGFWIFGTCLYAFASRRVGRACGCVAALIPVFTLAHYYASEARPYGLVLGCCGLMLVCWQRTREVQQFSSPKTYLCLLGLSASFLIALLCHAFSVYLLIPFLLAESYSAIAKRRVHLATCAALLLPLAFVVPVYLPIFHSLKSFNLRYEVLHPQISLQHSVLLIFSPALVILLTGIALLAWQTSRPQRDDEPADTPPRLSAEELVLSLAFLLLPSAGILVSRFNHGQYHDRYFISCTAGFALLLAQLISLGRQSSRLAATCIAAMVLLLAGDSALAARARLVGSDIVQAEPVSKFPFTASPSRPLERNYAFRDDTSQLDILVTDERNNLYLFYYAPEATRRRIVFASPKADSFMLTTFRLLDQWANLNVRTASYPQFFATHKEFLVYASDSGSNGSCRDCLQEFLDAGYTLRSVRHDADNLLERFSR